MSLTKIQQTELDRRIRCFFLPGSHDRDVYIDLFNSLYPEKNEHYAYSPLFLLRRDIFLLLKFDHIAYFPALLLADIIIEGLVSNITAVTAGKNKSNNDFKLFYKKYFSFDDHERLIIRQLRNALQHNFNQLVIHIKNNGRQRHIFLTIKKYLENKISNTIGKKITYFKLGYQLSPKYTAIAEFGNYEPRKNYYLVKAKVNPRLLLGQMEVAIHKLMYDIKHDDRLALNLLKNLSVDNWMKVF